MGKSAPKVSEQKVTTTTNKLPEYAQPYYHDLLSRSQAVANEPYVPYEGQRIAGFTPEQEQVQAGVLGLQSPSQISLASQLAAGAGLQALTAGTYNPGAFSNPTAGFSGVGNFSMSGVPNALAQMYNAPQMAAAQTGFAPERFSLDMPEQFGLPQADRYMSPYIQRVLDIQKREAITDAQKTQLAHNLDAARRGTYGGSRQLLATTERERALGQQLGDIEASGLQAAWEQAQAQFERDRGATMTAQQANLLSALESQKTGAQVALANLDADTRARVQNVAAQLQSQGYTAEAALRVALANQQAGLTVGQQNLDAQLRAQQIRTTAETQTAIANQQAALDRQRIEEQSRQFAAQQQLASAAQATETARALGALGASTQETDLARLQAQAGVAGQEQQLTQQQLDQMYADFLRQRDYPVEQLSILNSAVQGLPIAPNTTQTTYAPPPSMAAQVLGSGIGALGLARTAAG